MNKKQLWDSLLQQAISGKLVPQLDTEPAVEQIGPAPAHTEETFELPEKWKWVKMSDISASIRYGYTASANTSGNVKLLRVTDLQDSQVNWNTVPCCEIDSEYLPRFKLEKYDIVIARSGSVGKSFVVDHLDTSKSCVFASYLIRIRLNSEAQVNISFIKYYLNSPFYWQSISLSSRGTTLKNVNAQQLGGLLVPLPPLEEQRRIVAKLDELKPLVDQFGETHDKLSELEADFPRKLKASILQAAMQGKLVPQLDSEPAVEQIGPAPAPDEVLFKLPEKWKWVKLKTIGQIIGGGTPSSAVAEYWDKPTINWITSADLRANKGIFIYSGARSISQLGLQKSSAKLFPAGTVIYTTRGACIGDVAVAALESCTNQGCKSFVPDTAHITSLWGYYALKHAAPFIRRLSSGTTFAEISGKRFSEIAIPLPPLEEQRRIVERIEQLFAEVDKMSACKAP